MRTKNNNERVAARSSVRGTYLNARGLGFNRALQIPKGRVLLGHSFKAKKEILRGTGKWPIHLDFAFDTQLLSCCSTSSVMFSANCYFYTQNKSMLPPSTQCRNLVFWEKKKRTIATKEICYQTGLKGSNYHRKNIGEADVSSVNPSSEGMTKG